MKQMRPPSSQPVTAEEIRMLAQRSFPKQVAWRRHLHQHPELSNEEFDTTAFLRKEVKKLGLRILPIRLKTGLLAEIEGSSPGPTVIIRTDIDALPILEQTGLPFASKRAGCMHACGHDMHMATILGTANLIAQCKRHLKGKVRFIFQPAEEMPPGGAIPMIANGALKNGDVIFGLHVDPDIPAGKIGLRDGSAMASVYDFDLTVHGRTGHAARPHLTVDAIATSAEIIESLHKVVSRETDPIDSVVITFGKISGGTARNIIADSVQLTGTARTLSPRLQKLVPSLIKRTATNIARARGASCSIFARAHYPVLANNVAVNEFLAAQYQSLYGKGKVVHHPAVLGGEDFACYLQKLPGAMFRLGIMNHKLKANQPWHSPKFIADETALPYGSALLAFAALQYGWNGLR
ncbi:MAG: amidohydrolase [bacterium]|nr:amidohydrolase [bacterium]